MKSLIHALVSIVAVLALSFNFSYAAHHEGGHEHHGGHDMDHSNKSMSDCMSDNSCPITHGEVKNINQELGKITLKHGEIVNLEMPPMTMVLNVKDRTMLDGLSVGDHVMFQAVSIDGEFVITMMNKDEH
jgi:Cu(I)/Ag(I) efflux system protein CusF